MPGDVTINIVLPDGVDELDVDNFMFKALNQQVNGDVHGESFDDPAMISVAQRFEELHDRQYQEMLQEIFNELDKDYT